MPTRNPGCIFLSEEKSVVEKKMLDEILEKLFWGYSLHQKWNKWMCNSWSIFLGLLRRLDWFLREILRNFDEPLKSLKRSQHFFPGDFEVIYAYSICYSFTVLHCFCVCALLLQVCRVHALCGPRHFSVPRRMEMGEKTDPSSSHASSQRRHHISHWANLHIHPRARPATHQWLLGRNNPLAHRGVFLWSLPSID